MTSENRLVSWFKKVAIAEGISFLVLLLIAMPLKYFADMPMGVKIIGWAHGALFVLYIILVFPTRAALQKNLFWLFWALVASILPFGTFVLEKRLHEKNAVRV